MCLLWGHENDPKSPVQTSVTVNLWVHWKCPKESALSLAHTTFSHWNEDVCTSSPPLSLAPTFSPLFSSPLLLRYWSSWALWVQRVKAWKAKQPRFQRSHESLKCLLFQSGPERRVRCASDPRAHLEIQWLNLAHPTLNQSIPIISYCLPSATGPDEAEREGENTLWRPTRGESCSLVRPTEGERESVSKSAVWRHFECILLGCFCKCKALS